MLYKDIDFADRRYVSRTEYERDKNDDIKMNALVCDCCWDLIKLLIEELFYQNPKKSEIIKTLLDMNLRGKQIINALAYLNNDFNLFEKIILSENTKEKKDLVLAVNIMEAKDFLDEIYDDANKAFVSGVLDMSHEQQDFPDEEIAKCYELKTPKYDASKYTNSGK